MTKQKIVRITTVPISLEKLLSGQLRYMSSFYEVIAISSERGKLEKLGKSQGVAVFPLEMTRRITPLYDLFAVIRLYLFLRKTKPYIVHTHTPKAGIVGMVAARLAGVPHRLHTVAGLPLLEVSGSKRKLLNWVEQFTYRCATNVYPNSFGLMDIILAHDFCAPEKLNVLANGSSNGIDTSHFSPSLFTAAQNSILKEQLGIPSDAFVFVFVGRLVKDKGINEMVVAFELLQKDNPTVHLLLVGDYESDLDPLSSSTLESIHNNPFLHAVGFQNDVRPYLALSNVLVFPSYREGFPNGVLQAGAMGLPCVVSDINGCNEIIADDINGLIIPVKDALALYNAMKRLATDSDLLAKMRLHARSLIVSRYEQEVVWNAILETYRSL
ncbi:glycosyltransferase family 4 protein [Flavobacterium psychrotolerans]|uniref:Glycosyltransferase family 1 protein n=1 Tax=Flavobacterium psychrotolerans TaxID=2169410 RepID=A0A2U1JG67_9FLAO|nr:glycosyltransferase family 4 protein [Flavobacterium psychrotolerans]PWA04025.1 glycosyltransferase family 1 protein [Flavobacterium psychrotolerans]